MKKYICFLFWHKTSKFNDSGYLICDRCGKHEYWDGDFYNGLVILKAYNYIKSILFKVESWYKIKYKNQLPF